MQDGTPPSPCQICQRTMRPSDRVTVQDGALCHARCVEQRVVYLYPAANSVT